MSPRAQLKWGPARLWRWRADRERDRRRWAGAGRNYERYLALVADDTPIWIQLGHARKESGDLTGAKQAYEQALTLPGGVEAQRHLATLWTLERLAIAAGAASEAAGGREWRAAAATYASYLETSPYDGAIWIQYGHALRAIGDPGGAMIAYRQAAALPVSEEDGWFQLACVLRSQGLDAGAEPHFRRALQLAPRFEVYRNLADQPNLLAAATPVREARCLILDISDLLYFLSDHGRVSGIQRVELELVKAMLASDRAASSATFDEIVFCFSEFGWAWALEPAALRDIIDYTESVAVDSATAEAVRERLRVGAAPCVPAAGSAYIVLGGFWGGADARILNDRMRSLGVTFGVLAHDLFAITMPELCVEGVTAPFEASLRAGVATWDFIMTNSAFTAGDVKDFIGRNSLRAVPVITLPLAHGLAGSRKARATAVSALPEDLKGQPFVLCVGTIEPRKNHAALVEVWASLAEKHPGLPLLVLAGRQGWRSDNLVRRLESGADQKVRWLPDVSDPQLRALYGGCQFTVFPSFAEGWGLPVGESLSHGKVCVTSNRTAMPEVGGRFAIYADPHDKGDLARVLETLLFDGQTLARRQALIKRAFRPRTWSDVASDLVTEISAFMTRAPCQTEAPYASIASSRSS